MSTVLRARTDIFSTCAQARLQLSRVPGLEKKLIVSIPCALAMASCYNNAGSTDGTCEALTRSSPTPMSQWTGSVFTIVMENKSRERHPRQQARAVHQPARDAGRGRGGLSRLVRAPERAELPVDGRRRELRHPRRRRSESSTRSTRRRTSPISSSSPGLTWKAYQESMGEPCGLTSHGRYAAKHNPFVYFDDINGWDGKKFQPSHALQRARRRLLAARRGHRGEHGPEVRVHHAEPRQRHARRLDRAGRSVAVAARSRRSWRPTRTRTAA